ncbi:hypothetical protein ACNO7T_15345 [Vibrio campbellii]
MYWLVSMTGNRQTLFNLDLNVTSPHFRIYREADEETGEDFYLQFPHIKGNSDLNQVVPATKGLIELLNGSIAITNGFNHHANLGGIEVDALFSSPSIDSTRWNKQQYLESLPSSNPFIGQEDTSKILEPFNSKVSAYIEMCQKYQDVYILLRQASASLDWRNLYCIWDTICHYGGGQKNVISDLSLNANEISAFTGSANSYGLLGISARHGVKGWAVPTNTVTLEQARDIIHDVVVKYLAHKYCFNCEKKAWEATR